MSWRFGVWGQNREPVSAGLSTSQAIMHKAYIVESCGLFLMNYELWLVFCEHREPITTHIKISYLSLLEIHSHGKTRVF